jgi:hypothetical protein
MTTSREEEQRTRRETLRNDALVRKQDQTTTYFGMNELASPTEGGRFKTDTILTGREAVPEVAPMPSGPWSTPDPVGQEPPLGLAVDAMEPVGEAFEVERSLLDAGASPPVGQCGANGACDVGQGPVTGHAAPGLCADVDGTRDGSFSSAKQRKS